jgi:hypothetical protein
MALQPGRPILTQSKPFLLLHIYCHYNTLTKVDWLSNILEIPICAYFAAVSRLTTIDMTNEFIQDF